MTSPALDAMTLDEAARMIVRYISVAESPDERAFDEGIVRTILEAYGRGERHRAYQKKGGAALDETEDVHDEE